MRRLLQSFCLFLPLFACSGEATTTDTETSGAESTSTSTSTSEGEVDVRCNPSIAPDSCGGDRMCCSDDPAAQEGKLPAFGGAPLDDVYGVAIFAESNNALSHSGECVEAGSGPLLNGCPRPCNPRWDPADVAAICGDGQVCCQTLALQPKDCVQDPETGRWRAVTGADIFAGLSVWGMSHTTPQDPTATSCALFAGVMDPNDPTYADCLRQLSVADQRGWCADDCPCVEDTCELLNDDATPKCAP